MTGLRTRRLIAVVLLASFLPVSTIGCFGHFALTRKVYRFNRDLSHDRWLRWIGFLALNITWIYPGAGLIDVLFANSVEFWGGANPFASAEPTTRYAYGPDGEILMATAVSPGTIEIQLLDRDGEWQVLRLVLETESMAAYDREGRLVARVGDVNGVPALLELPR